MSKTDLELWNIISATYDADYDYKYIAYYHKWWTDAQ